MTTSVFMGYYDALSRLRAVRMLDTASAASVPHWSEEQRAELVAAAYPESGDEHARRPRPSPISVNGKRMSSIDAKGALQGAFGAGFEAA